MGDDEGMGPFGGGDGPPDDEVVGRQLQEFFLELLQGDNLKRFQGDGREPYINERRSRLHPDTQRLLDSADLRELEQQIAKITGSQAVLLYVVCPPM